MNSRRSLRLTTYDYTQEGAYLVTTCVRGRACVFGRVEDDQMSTNAAGRLAQEAWVDLSRLPGVVTDTLVVMPNHVHGVLFLRAGQGPRLHLGTVVCQYKSGVSRELDRLESTPGPIIWQRGYHDRIIRDEAELRAIPEYIALNPFRRALDRENPNRITQGRAVARPPSGRSRQPRWARPTCVESHT
jgi:putative transposase